MMGKNLGRHLSGIYQVYLDVRSVIVFNISRSLCEYLDRNWLQANPVCTFRGRDRQRHCRVCHDNWGLNIMHTLLLSILVESTVEVLHKVV